MTGPEDLQSNRVRVPFPARAEVFSCPVRECGWTATTADIMAVENTVTKASGPSIDEAISAMSIARAKTVDAFLRKHLETHDVIDYLRTIRELEQQMYNAGYTGVRPHRYVAQQMLENLDGARGSHSLAQMTGEQRGQAAETLQRYQEIDREPGIGWP